MQHPIDTPDRLTARDRVTVMAVAGVLFFGAPMLDLLTAGGL